MNEIEKFEERIKKYFPNIMENVERSLHSSSHDTYLPKVTKSKLKRLLLSSYYEKDAVRDAKFLSYLWLGWYLKIEDTVGKWKFVEDNEYPKSGTRVLVYFPAHSTSVMDALYDHDGRFYVDGIDRTKVVVCWRYLPSNEEMEFIRKQYREDKEN